MTDGALKILIRSRSILRNERERKQRQPLTDNDLFHETIRSKLSGLAETNQFANFSKCGRERIFRTCRSCGDVHEFAYRCSLKWCPRCQWFITERRREKLAVWVKHITQPKHLVLTQKNFPILTPSKLREHSRNLKKMRRSLCFEKVRGGSVSIEITNEGNGWHLHSHWLLDVRWLDMAAVSLTWSGLVGQEFAIVKIKDARDHDYLQEVTKYVAEGSELAKWPAEHLLEFVTAIRSRRFFFAFGSLFKMGHEIRAEILQAKAPSPVCDCGASDWMFETEEQTVLAEIRKLNRRR